MSRRVLCPDGRRGKQGPSETLGALHFLTQIYLDYLN